MDAKYVTQYAPHFKTDSNTQRLAYNSYSNNAICMNGAYVHTVDLDVCELNQIESWEFWLKIKGLYWPALTLTVTLKRSAVLPVRAVRGQL